ncbi:MAG: hypothetical protein AAGH83_07480 [Pseudomonadota bacterium]
MTDRDRLSAREIAEEIDAERDALAEALGELQGRLSLDGLLSGLDNVKSRTGALGDTVGDTVRKHPAAVALAGAGLALLLYGLNRPSSHRDPEEKEDAAETPNAEDLRDQLMEGTEDLTPEALTRVVEARLQAIDAQRHMEGRADAEAPITGGLVKSHPLLIGLIGAAVGTAIAAFMPRSREDWDDLRARRDKLFADAEALFEREKSVAVDLAKRASDTAMETARDLASRRKDPPD